MTDGVIIATSAETVSRIFAITETAARNVPLFVRGVMSTAKIAMTISADTVTTVWIAVIQTAGALNATTAATA